jgi:hypothetical protein
MSISVYGEGMTPCSKWTSDSQGSSHNPLQISWILGFVSAADLTGSAAKRMSADWMQGFITGYCEKRPDATLVAAAREMLRFLKSQ